jgi:uncharacterized protein (TIGR00375 family)
MFIADFHIHSKYSRATSRDCVPEMLDWWARRKGLDVIGTGDFTHPAWRGELKEKLAPAGDGLYTLKDEFRRKGDIAGADAAPRFIVTGEISSIYKKNGKVRKVHNLILLPGLEDAEALAKRLEAIGNLHSDGRPILGLDSRDLLEITLNVAPKAVFIPAHIWTPHFSLFGAYSGFDDIYECFEDLTEHIHALETGLSSDPPMNWRLSALDRFTLVSNSDAHSPAKLAREANMFDTDISYSDISRALETGGGFRGTIEFFPEEGKYHYDGHRNCKVCMKPSETESAAGVCPVCGGRITVGVLHRVEALADREEGYTPPAAKRYERLIPLHEVIAASMGMTTASKKVIAEYDNLIGSVGPELYILREAPLEDIGHKAGRLIAEGIRRLRCGDVNVEPGYDGEYGRVSIMDRDEISLFSGQMSFNEEIGEDLAISESTLRAQCPPVGTVKTALQTEAAPAVGPEPQSVKDELNPEQREAVFAADKAVAVIAGPGTGKTKTLVSRIAWLVEARGVRPSRITAVTFTNKAAGEMRSRLEQRFGGRKTVREMTIGTFHSICLQILRRWNGGGNITVIDEANALSVVGDILTRLGFKDSPRDVLRGISLIKNGAAGAESVPSSVCDAYCAELKRYGALDYDDILVEALKVCEEEENSFVPDASSHILVDEFQDINAVQYRLIKAWSKNGAGVFVIGDPDQSIYGFRGSDSRCFRQFFDDYSCRQIRLARNYRSTPEILSCAGSVISRSAGGGSRVLEAGRENGAKVRLLEADSAFDEALFVAKEINRMVGGIDMLDAHRRPASAAKRQRGFSDIAVLYRTNRQADMLEQCLAQEGIPYVVAGRDEFLTEPQVRGAVAFFSFLQNPHDLLSLRIILRADAKASRFAQEIAERYVKTEQSVSALAAILYDAGSTGRGLDGLLLKYEPLVSKEKPRDLVEAWINDNALSDLKCMDMLLDTSAMQEDMASFIHNLVLGRESDVLRSGKRYSSDAVSLMTLHGAKGLEFPAVFLCGVTDGLVPFKDRFGGCNLEEERRLFFVGMTRAKDELIMLTSPASSPLLAGLPEEALLRGKAAERKTAPARQLSFL